MATTTNNHQARFIKHKTVKDITGLSSSEIYRRIAAGTFPKQIILGPKSVAWIESEVVAWCDQCIAESRKQDEVTAKYFGNAYAQRAAQ